MSDFFDANYMTPNQVAKIPFFQGLDNKHIDVLANKLKLYNHKKGSLLISEGNVSQRMYFIIEGRVRVFKKKYTGATETICELEAPNYFGEMSIIDGGPRSANVEALTEVVLGELIWDDIKYLFDDKPEIMIYIMKNICYTMSMRLRRINSMYTHVTLA